MRIDELWTAMEAEAGYGGAWWLRLVRPDASCPLFAAMETSTRRRGILLRLPPSDIPSRRRWPRCQGLEPVALEIDGSAHFGVILKEERFADVFSALTEDLIRRVGTATTAPEQAQAFLGQLARWQKFLTASSDGLTEEAERGLWGELYVVRRHLLPLLGSSAIAAWTGPQGAQQDFQFPTGALEVKTTLAKQPQVVRITSERQMDAALWSALFLCVIALDSREGEGDSLPAMVGAVREMLQSDASAREAFEDGLLAAGYLDVHSRLYADRGHLVRSERFFQVGPEFPAIVENELPRGVGSVNYGLAIEACEHFGISVEMVINTLKHESPA